MDADATRPTTASPAPRKPGLADARQSLGPAVLDDLFPEGPELRRSLQTYTMLLAMAGFIATFGLYADSVAAIIGAMVVAPLGGAIMALAAALVTGRTRWQWLTLAQIVLGSLMVIGIGFGVSLVIPDPLGLTPSLEARTFPGLLDLGVALASGAAGAYVAVRRTGTDALPGVAIAVSLVPPLATVGICLELGRIDDAGGAMLLFLTNLSAIVVIACIVFVLFGVLPDREHLRERHRLRNALAVAIASLVVIAIPLAWNSADSVIRAVRGAAAAPHVEAWIGDRDLVVVSWSVAGPDVLIAVTGTDVPPDPAPLARDLAREYGQPVTVRVTYSPLERTESSATP